MIKRIGVVLFLIGIIGVAYGQNNQSAIVIHGTGPSNSACTANMIYIDDLGIAAYYCPLPAGKTSGTFTPFYSGGGGSGTPGGSSGQGQYNSSGSFAGYTMGGDCTIVFNTGVITCTKSNGTAFGTGAFAAIGNYVLTSTTVNGHPLTGNVTVAPADLAAGALVSGMTGTTQSAADNTTKLATDAFVLANSSITPLTTLGDTMAENATPAPARIAGSTSATMAGYTQTGTGSASALPLWTLFVGGGVSPLAATISSLAPGQTLVSNSSNVLVNGTPGIPVDSQTGTSYILPATDNLTLVVGSNAAATAWAGTHMLVSNFAWPMLNNGAGPITYTPASGTVYPGGGSSQILPQNWFGMAYTNNAATATYLPVMPTYSAFPNAPNGLDFNSTTGQFTAASSLVNSGTTSCAAYYVSGTQIGPDCGFLLGPSTGIDFSFSQAANTDAMLYGYRFIDSGNLGYFIQFQNNGKFTNLFTVDTSGNVTAASLTGTSALTNLPAQAANTVVMNSTTGSAKPTAVAMPTSGTNGCAGASQALIYNTTTGILGCNTITTSGGITGTWTTTGNIVTTDGSGIAQDSGVTPSGLGFPWLFTSGATLSASSTDFVGTGVVATAELTVTMPVPRNGTVSNLFCHYVGVLTTGETVTITARHYVSGTPSNTSLSCGMSVGVQYCSDTTSGHAFTVATSTQDSIDLQSVPSASPAPTVGDLNCTVLFQ